MSLLEPRNLRVIGAIFIAFPLGAWAQLATIHYLYNVIGFGLPQDFNGWMLAFMGVLSILLGASLIRETLSKPVETK